MRQPFFPDPIFGWAFLLVMAGLLAVAAYVDWRTLRIPRWVSLALLGSGLVVNLVRGAWVGGQGAAVWILGGGSAWAGAADGLLFALAGFALGFVIFVVLWILGACGGGDVKIFAALGAWLGPELAVLVLIGTLVLVTLVVAARTAGDVLTGRSRLMKALHPSRPAPGRQRRRLISYSLPLALAAVLVSLWEFRGDLHLAPARPPGERTQHVQPRPAPAALAPARQLDA